MLLRPYVGFTETRTDEQRWLEPPEPRVTMLINIAEPFGGFPQAFVSGLTQTCVGIGSRPGTVCLDLKLRPLGAYTLLGTSMHEISGRVVDFGDVFGRVGSEIVDSLREIASWPARFERLDQFLASRTRSGPRPAPAISHAWRRIVATNGQLRIDALADEIGWSPRYLIAGFREQVGLPPKTVARLVRFSHVLRLQRQSKLRWAHAAARSGYFDQAHLHRDFRLFTGRPPAAFLRLLREQTPRGSTVKYFQDTAVS